MKYRTYMRVHAYVHDASRFTCAPAGRSQHEGRTIILTIDHDGLRAMACHVP